MEELGGSKVSAPSVAEGLNKKKKFPSTLERLTNAIQGPK